MNVILKVTRDGLMCEFKVMELSFAEKIMGLTEKRKTKICNLGFSKNKIQMEIITDVNKIEIFL
jgi:hypothetical protein